MESKIIEEIDLMEDLFHNCRKVIETGMWLMRNGYGHMMFLPYIAPSGCYWRCEFHTAGMPSKPLFRYSSASEGKYLNDHGGKRVRRSITSKGLARAILRNAPPELVKVCEGDLSQNMEAWLVQLERYLEMGWVPAAFNDSEKLSRSKWGLVGMVGVSDSWIDAPPGYVMPSA